MVRDRLGTELAGHTGTLDPLAAGVLPVCLGAATKLAQWLQAEEGPLGASGACAASGANGRGGANGWRASLEA